MQCPNKKNVLSYVTICGCRESCICYVTFCVASESSKRKFPKLLIFKGAISNFQVFLRELYDEQPFQRNFYITVKLIDFYDFEVATIWFPFGFPSHDSSPKTLSLWKYFNQSKHSIQAVLHTVCIVIGQKARRRTKCSRVPEVNKMVSTSVCKESTKNITVLHLDLQLYLQKNVMSQNSVCHFR